MSFSQRNLRSRNRHSPRRKTYAESINFSNLPMFYRGNEKILKFLSKTQSHNSVINTNFLSKFKNRNDRLKPNIGANLNFNINIPHRKAEDILTSIGINKIEVGKILQIDNKINKNMSNARNTEGSDKTNIMKKELSRMNTFLTNSSNVFEGAMYEVETNVKRNLPGFRGPIMPISNFANKIKFISNDYNTYHFSDHESSSTLSRDLRLAAQSARLNSKRLLERKSCHLIDQKNSVAENYQIRNKQTLISIKDDNFVDSINSRNNKLNLILISKRKLGSENYRESKKHKSEEDKYVKKGKKVKNGKSSIESNSIQTHIDNKKFENRISENLGNIKRLKINPENKYYDLFKNTLEKANKEDNGDIYPSTFKLKTLKSEILRNSLKVQKIIGNLKRTQHENDEYLKSYGSLLRANFIKKDTKI